MAEKKMIGKVKAGDLLLLTSGAYSDYQVHSLVKVLKDLDLDQIRDEYLTLHPDQRSRYRFEVQQFIDYLSDFVDEVPHREFYLSDYDDADDMRLKG